MTSRTFASPIAMLFVTLIAAANFGCGGGHPQQPIMVSVAAPQSVQAGSTGQVAATVSGPGKRNLGGDLQWKFLRKYLAHCHQQWAASDVYGAPYPAFERLDRHRDRDFDSRLPKVCFCPDHYSFCGATKSAETTALLRSATDSGSESLLNGQYAFQLQGFDSGGNAVGVVGSLTADGTGKITGGEEDSYAMSTAQDDAKIDATSSIYSVGPDHRGFMVLAISGAGTTYFRFALGSPNASNVAAIGRIIEFGEATGQASQVAGTMRLQDSTSFAASKFKGNYVLGITGVDPNGADSLAGTFVTDGVSAISSGTFDLDRPDGIASNLPALQGAIFTCCSENGRGTLDLQINTTAFASSQFVFYMISSADAFVGTDISVDMGGGFTGELIGIPAGSMFSQNSLSGVSVVRQVPMSSNAPIVHIGTVSADGNGTITLDDNVNNAGTFSTTSTVYSYTVASNGRVALSGGSAASVLYLYGQNQAFLVGTSRNATFGILEPQVTGPFSNASFSGAYAVGTENPSANTVTMESGVLTADGNGNATGTSDQSSSTGLTPNQSLNFTYSFPANGVGNVGSGTTAILISGNKLVFINNTDANPTITVVEK